MYYVRFFAHNASTLPALLTWLLFACWDCLSHQSNSLFHGWQEAGKAVELHFPKTLFLTWYDVFWNASLSTLEFDGGTYFSVKRLPATLHHRLLLLRTQIFPHVVHFLGLRSIVPDEGSTLRITYWTRRHDGMTMNVQKTRNSSAAQAKQNYTANALAPLSLVLKPFSLKQNHCNFEKNYKNTQGTTCILFMYNIVSHRLLF